MSNGPSFFFGDPEEINQRLQEVHDHQEMHVLDFRHTFEAAWQSLSSEHLSVVVAWMNSVASLSPDDAAIRLAVQAGSLSRLLSVKENSCVCCGKNHDDEVNELLRQSDDEKSKLAYEESQRIVAEHDANVATYRLVQDFKEGGFKCTGCGMRYPSLEDRMMKAPGIEGCPGCIQKQKWG